MCSRIISLIIIFFLLLLGYVVLPCIKRIILKRYFKTLSIITPPKFIYTSVYGVFALFISTLFCYHLTLAIIIFFYCYGLALSLLVIIDLQYLLLPDCLTQSLVWLGLAFNGMSGFVSPSSAIFGAMIGYGLLYLINLTYYGIYRQHGLGRGDCKLMGAVGALLGYQAIPIVLCIASISTLIVHVLRRHLGKATQRLFPLGPGITLGLLLSSLKMIY